MKRALPLALLTLAGCIAHLKPEPPRRILRVEKPVAVWLTSRPPGVRVFAAGAAGEPTSLLGTTPLVIGEVQLTKEIWKHGPGDPPPPVEGPVLLEGPAGRAAVRAAPGDGPRFTVLVETGPSSPPRRLDLELDPEALEPAFRTGRIELDVGAAAAPATPSP